MLACRTSLVTSVRRATTLVVQQPAQPGHLGRERRHVHKHLDVGLDLEGSQPRRRAGKLDSVRRAPGRPEVPVSKAAAQLPAEKGQVAPGPSALLAALTIAL